MFVQADARDSRAQSGLGIGLTLVRSLVEMHGGSVDGAQRRARPGQRVRRAPAARRTTHARRRAGRRDCDPAKSAACRASWSWTTTTTPPTAWRAAAAARRRGARGARRQRPRSTRSTLSSPAAVFLDLGMPGMDGYEVAKQIRARADARAHGAHRRSPAGDRKGTGARPQAAGFNQHLVKPAGVGALQAVLASLAR